MGQKTNPISNRIGITRGWDSNWVGGNYAEKIAEDYEIRKYLGSRLAKASLSRIIIERTLKLITVTIHAARPGVIIGQIEGRVSYRRAIKMAIATAMRVGAEGIKVQISGRVGGAEIARSEMFKEGRTPLHTFRADIDYALAVAHTQMGTMGIKVWICNGEKYGKQDLSPNAGFAANAQAPAGGRREGGRGERRGGRGDRRGDRGDRGERRERRDDRDRR